LADGVPTALVQEGNLWTLEVKLKKGVRWSDGVEITAQDVAFTLQTAKDLQLPGGWAARVNPNVLDRVEAKDSQTLKYFFKISPGLGNWQFGLSQSVVLAKHFWEPIVAQARQAGPLEAQQRALFQHVPVNEPTAGEMLLSRRGAGVIELTRNPNYFWAGSTVKEYANGAYVEEKTGDFKFQAYGDPQGTPAVTLTRGPYVDKVVYKVYDQQLPAIVDLRSDVIDYILSPQGIDPALRKHLTGRDIATIENPASQVRFLDFNLQRPPLDSKEFRQAVATLIDREFIANIVLQKLAIPVYTFVPKENRFWQNPNVPTVGRELTREQRIKGAVTLLKGAGFSWDQEPRFDQATGVVPGIGLKLPSGEHVAEIKLLAPAASFDPLRASAALWIERWLKEAGIPVATELGVSSEILRRVFVQKDFQMVLLQSSLANYPAYLVSLFHSQGPNNAGGYSNPEYNAIAEQFFVETDLAGAQDKARQLQRLIATDLPVLPLFNVPLLEAYRGDVVKWAFTDVLNGVQGYFQGINGALSYTRVE
jgi:ABC-type transport system substrate-binding protein